MKSLPCVVLMVALGLAGCVSNPLYEPVANLTPLQVSFVDSAWNGAGVPKLGMCQLCGGEGQSPAIRVQNIPVATSAIVVEFNDIDWPPGSEGGGHGVLRIPVTNQQTVIVPSVPEQTLELPSEVTLVSRHILTWKGSPGYLGPCACQSSNRFEAVVRAIKMEQSSQGPSKLLGQGKLSLGVCCQ